MPGDLQEKKVRIGQHEAEVSTYIYERNRRQPIAAGTRTSNVLIRFSGDDRLRLAWTNKAIELAVLEWQLRWGGSIPWSLSEIMVYHLTCQVLVELRVPPPTNTEAFYE